MASMSFLRNDAAMVVLSGGQDSTTCLGWALDRFNHVLTVGFDYGQRHRVELECRKEILARIGELNSSWPERLEGPDTILDLRRLSQIGGMAMTSAFTMEMGKNGLPTPCAPGQNILLMTPAVPCPYQLEDLTSELQSRI